MFILFFTLETIIWMFYHMSRKQSSCYQLKYHSPLFSDRVPSAPWLASSRDEPRFWVNNHKSLSIGNVHWFLNKKIINKLTILLSLNCNWKRQIFGEKFLILHRHLLKIFTDYWLWIDKCKHWHAKYVHWRILTINCVFTITVPANY